MNREQQSARKLYKLGTTEGQILADYSRRHREIEELFRAAKTPELYAIALQKHIELSNEPSAKVVVQQMFEEAMEDWDDEDRVEYEREERGKKIDIAAERITPQLDRNLVQLGDKNTVRPIKRK